MSFTEQPNEMLDLLLNNPAIIPLPQRIRLRSVSRRWLPVLEDGLARENTLVIRDGNADYPKSKPDHLVIRGGNLTEEIIRTLVRLFSSPTELTLAFGKFFHPSPSWSTVPTLLTQLGTNLTTVKLYGGIDQTVSEDEPLARALADLPSLTWLTLEDYLNHRLLPHLGPVLSRLEAFASAHNENAPEFASLLSSSLSPRCTRLLLVQSLFDSLTGPLLAQLSTSLTCLQLMACYNPTALESLWQMHGLTRLALGFDFLWVDDLNSSLFRHLVPFARLTDLKLFDLTYHTPLALPSKMEKPLSTIQRLTLKVYFIDFDSPVDYEAFFKSIGAWFPALAKLTLITKEDTFPALQGSLGKLPFSVETVDSRYFDHWAPDW